MPELTNEIQNWDGKSIDYLERLYLRFKETENLVADLLHFLKSESLEIGSSWLLKRHLECGNPLSVSEVSVLYGLAADLVFWESKLHVLQCIPLVGVSVKDAAPLEDFLRLCLADKNKFVRAWAYGGFYLLADKMPEYRTEARQLIEHGLASESAAVKARIRNAVKRGFLS